MAVADAKLTGRPGVVLVSRGPGACNASIAVHTAEQDEVPLILLVGQAERRDVRPAAAQVPELIARAWSMAMGGVPAPVVLSLPEDVLPMPCAAPPLPA